MVIADPNGAFLKVNPACIRTLGYSEAELVSKPFVDFIYPEDKQSTLDEMARQLQRGFSLNFENRYVCKDGSLRWLSWRAAYDKTDGVTYATARDFTDLKMAEESLRENQVRLDLALQAAHMGAWRWEIKENKRYFDDLTCQLLGIDAAAFKGTAQEFSDVVHPDDREMVKTALARTLELDALYEPTYRVVWPEGSIHYISSRSRLVRDRRRAACEALRNIMGRHGAAYL